VVYQLKKEDIKNFTTVAISKEDLKAVHFLQNRLQLETVEQTVHSLIRKSLQLFGVALP